MASCQVRTAWSAGKAASAGSMPGVRDHALRCSRAMSTASAGMASRTESGAAMAASVLMPLGPDFLLQRAARLFRWAGTTLDG